MGEKKLNRNPEVTKAAIKAAFIEKLGQKPFDTVSVAEITRAAGINRVTFYSHYDNVCALMAEVETEMADEVISAMSGLFKSADFHELTHKMFFDLFFSDPQIGVWFMSSQTTGVGERKIYEYAKGVCLAEWRRHKQVSDEELGRFFDFYYYGFTAVLRKSRQGAYGDDAENIRKELTAIGAHMIKYIFDE